MIPQSKIAGLSSLLLAFGLITTLAWAFYDHPESKIAGAGAQVLAMKGSAFKDLVQGTISHTEALTETEQSKPVNVVKPIDPPLTEKTEAQHSVDSTRITSQPPNTVNNPTQQTEMDRTDTPQPDAVLLINPTSLNDPIKQVTAPIFDALMADTLAGTVAKEAADVQITRSSITEPTTISSQSPSLTTLVESMQPTRPIETARVTSIAANINTVVPKVEEVITAEDLNATTVLNSRRPPVRPEEIVAKLVEQSVSSVERGNSKQSTRTAGSSTTETKSTAVLSGSNANTTQKSTVSNSLTTNYSGRADQVLRRLNANSRRANDGNPIFRITIGSSGRVTAITLTRSSGNIRYDRDLERQIRRVRFPSPPGGSFTVLREFLR